MLNCPSLADICLEATLAITARCLLVKFFFIPTVTLECVYPQPRRQNQTHNTRTKSVTLPFPRGNVFFGGTGGEPVVVPCRSVCRGTKGSNRLARTSPAGKPLNVYCRDLQCNLRPVLFSVCPFSILLQELVPVPLL